jgi:hypothetical protein
MNLIYYMYGHMRFICTYSLHIIYILDKYVHCA